MEKIKQFATKHWRILTVCGLTILSVLLIVGVVVQMKKTTKEEPVKTETEGKYPIKSETIGEDKLQITIDGSTNPDHKWVLVSYNDAYISLETEEEKNEKLTMTATMKEEEGVSVITLNRVKESDETAIAAEVTISVIVDEDEEENRTIMIGTSNIRTFVNNMKIGEGTSAPATVNATSGILDIEIDSKLEDITCTASNEEIVTVDTPDVEFFVSEPKETGDYLEGLNGEKVPLYETYQDAVKTTIMIHAVADGDVTLTISSPGLSIAVLEEKIELLKNAGIQIEDEVTGEITFEKDETDYSFEIKELEHKINDIKKKMERNTEEAYKGFEYTLSLHIEDGKIYIAE